MIREPDALYIPTDVSVPAFEILTAVARGMATGGGLDFIGGEKQRKVVESVDPKLTPEQVVSGLAIALNRAAQEADIDERTEAIFFHEMLPFAVATHVWRQHGWPVFSLTDDFFHAVAVTDFGDVGDEPLKHPFPAYMVHLPENTLVAGARKMFIYQMPRTIPVLEDASNGNQPNKKLLKGFNVEFTHTRLTLALHSPPYTQWNNDLSRKSYLTEDVLLDGDATKGHNPVVDDERDPPALRYARRVLANMLTYIESSGPLPEKKHRPSDPVTAVEREHAEKPVYRVGRPVKLGPVIRKVLREGQAGHHWKLQQKHVVRGHWRNQAYGPQHSLRRRQWIEPFWKGPENLDAAFERTYEVK